MSLNKKGYTYHFRNILQNFSSWTKAKILYGKVSVPVELIYGDKDWSYDKERNSTKELLGLNNYHLIKDCGHFSFLEKM